MRIKCKIEGILINKNKNGIEKSIKKINRLHDLGHEIFLFTYDKTIDEKFLKTLNINFNFLELKVDKEFDWYISNVAYNAKEFFI